MGQDPSRRLSREEAAAADALAAAPDSVRRKRQLKERKWTLGARLRRPLLL